MTRDNRGEFIEYFADEQFRDGLLEPIYSTMPEAVFALFVGGITILALYGWTESVTLPAIVLVLFSGLLIVALPAPAAIVATITVVLVLAVALYAIYGGRT